MAITTESSLRLRYYYAYPLVWFFSPKNSRQNSCDWNDLDSIILLSLYNFCIMICNYMALVLFRIFGNSKKIIDFIDC
jgi:hypothetical protein